MKTENRHVNIPVFIPHLGCPNMCVFCNQRLISGQNEFDISSVSAIIDSALATIPPGTDTEIAFFGGSFTGIDRGLMVNLLDIAKEYTDAGRVGSIRLSTRPDYINREILEILEKYRVGTVELGIQSMDDGVLAASRRGHTAAQSVQACRLVREYGFGLIGQMMIGLPGADSQSECATAAEICELGADGARVYPMVVFRGTELCEMAQSGNYTPLDTQTAVERTKNVLSVFAQRVVPVIRVGLCASENLASDDAVAGGANHPAIGELAMSELYYDIICRELDNSGIHGGSITVAVPRGEVSKAVGQKKKNTIRIKEKYGVSIVFREDALLEAYQIKTESYIPDRRNNNCI